MKNSFSASCFLALALCLASCKKENSNIGLDLIDDQLGVEYTEAAYLQAHTIREDSLVTSNRSATSLGYYDDPVFGKTTASVYSQFLLSTTGPNFGTATCDSVILSMTFKGFYGTLSPQVFTVYTLNGMMYKDSTYDCEDSIDVSTSLAGVQTIYPRPFDSLFAGNDTFPPQLRIKLNNSFGNFLLAASAGDLASNTAWVNYFKGLYITAGPVNTNARKAGGILSFKWADANTKITLYYHDAYGTHGNQGRASYSFIVDGNTASFNHYRHDYSGRPAITAQLNGNDTANYDHVYVQGLMGLKTKFYLPNIQFLKSQGDIAVNKAELILQTDASTMDNDFATPSKLVLVALDSAGKQILLSDYYEDQGGTYFGGTWDATKKQYRFNIARHIQDLLNGEKQDYGLILLASGSAVNPHRVVLGGGTTSSPHKMRLKITYTKLN
ncbi:MAG: DUF4270 domain-containing protein [Bacteroidia bacterium]|nr:DUF4270 domain-containing protein [Bacteroidia bacterium]